MTTKVFEKSGKLTMPNKNTSPNNQNIELTKQNVGKKLCFYNNILHRIGDAILKKAFLSGQDSLWYDGEYLPIYANANTRG